MSQQPPSHEDRTDPVGRAAAAHRQRMEIIAAAERAAQPAADEPSDPTDDR